MNKWFISAKIFQPWAKSFNSIKVRFKFSLKNSKIFLRFVWLRCSGLFRWCYVGVSLVFLGVPLVLRGVLSLFRGVSLFRRCPVFRCSVFRRSWFYSMLFNNRLAINNIRKFMISHTTRVSWAENFRTMCNSS